jgi:hypothetical protein
MIHSRAKSSTDIPFDATEVTYGDFFTADGTKSPAHIKKGAGDSSPAPLNIEIMILKEDC